MAVDMSTTLGDLVTEDPRRARILERFGLDYCCNGQRALSQAAGEGGVDAAEVAQALDLAPAPAADPHELPRQNAALAHDIVDTHHAYMWEEMPRLRALVDKVHSVHGEQHPELTEVKATYAEALDALDPHMTTEERVVFPAISRLERTRSPGPPGSLEGQIAQLRADHDAVGVLFRRIRSSTDGYAVPPDACHSYRAMLTGLEEMELDLHEHIHKENNILFPRALGLVQQVSTS